MVIEDLVSSARWRGSSPEALGWLGKLLMDEGINLLKAEDAELRRGTPVYVDADADVLQVQRLMALNHIRVLPIVKDGRVLGVVDLVELAMREDLGDGTVEEAASF